MSDGKTRFIRTCSAMPKCMQKKTRPHKSKHEKCAFRGILAPNGRHDKRYAKRGKALVFLMCLILVRVLCWLPLTDHEHHEQGLSRRFSDPAAGGSPLMWFGDHLQYKCAPLLCDLLEGLQAVLMHRADNHSNGSSSTPGWPSEPGGDHVHIHGH